LQREFLVLEDAAFGAKTGVHVQARRAGALVSRAEPFYQSSLRHHQLGIVCR
jgi:hypothetical protein